MRRGEGAKYFLWPDIDQLVSSLIVFATNSDPLSRYRGVQFESNAHLLHKFWPIPPTRCCPHHVVLTPETLMYILDRLLGHPFASDDLRKRDPSED
jgi:hypothetical protein